MTETAPSLMRRETAPSLMRRESSHVMTLVLDEGLVIDRHDFFLRFSLLSKLNPRKWARGRFCAKVIFLLSILYMLVVYSILFLTPSSILILYIFVYPMLFLIRIYLFIKSNSFLFLFDNCYLVNTALIIFICLKLPLDTYFLSIFAAVNGPVLWAVLPFRNTLAFHDIDKITSCYIHWAPTIVTWVVRWFPAKTSIGWIRTFATEDVIINPVYFWHDGSNWFWFILVPLSCFIIHDLIYAVVVHVIIKPNEEYSDSFTYHRSKENIIGFSIQRCPRWLQLLFFLFMSFLMYTAGILLSILCYRMFLIHSIFLAIQLIIMIWNGGCYYLDYFAYLALRASDITEVQSPTKTNRV